MAVASTTIPLAGIISGRSSYAQYLLSVFLPKGATTAYDSSAFGLLPAVDCVKSCEGLPTVAHDACIATCQQTGKTPKESLFGGVTEKLTGNIKSALVVMLGLILVIVAIALITR